jgi:hypothetical protein
MSEATIDELRISIEAKASDARGQLSALADDMTSAGRSARSAAPGVTTLAQALSTLSGAGGAVSTMREVSAALTALDGKKVSPNIAKQVSAIAASMGSVPSAAPLMQVAAAVSSLDGKKVSSSVGRQITSITKALQGMGGVTVDVGKFRELSTALTSLSNVPKNALSSTVNAMLKLPRAIESLDSVDMGGLATKARELSSALGSMPSSANGVTSAYKSIAAASRQAGGTMTGSGGGWMRSASDEADTLRGHLKSMAYDIRNVTIVAMAFKGLSNAIATCVDASNKYIEDMNLFNVSLGEYASSAQQYAEQVSSITGVNIQEWLRNQGTLATMTKGMGVASDSAATMSQNLTQLGYDLASFYNISDQDAFEKIRAGMAGELEPLRALGYDLSVARLQQDAFSMGITKKVSEMTQDEKAMLRYHAIMSQVSWAQGDMARTLESPSNMLRVLQGSLTSAARSIGNIFLPMIKAILPVAIAAARVVATLANMIADLTGGTQIASVEYGGGGDTGDFGSDDDTAAADDLADAYDGVGDSADGAADSVKELKRQVMGFDELNVMSAQASPSGGGGGSGGNGGKGGKGNGGGGGGSASDMPLQTYDFLGDASSISDDLYNAIMDMVKRAGDAFKPLVDAVKPVIAAIASQFEGLDIAGAAENAFMAFLNLVSNVARGVVEVVGPMMVALNIPETVALGFDLAAQGMLALASMASAAASGVKGFTDRAVVPLVSWVGDKLRGAIRVCIDVLSSWQTWFIQNTGAINDLGQAAGTGAALVLALARAVADRAFDIAAGAFTALSGAVQWLLGVLVNSEAARVAAGLLGAALTVWAIGKGLDAALTGIGNAFTLMGAMIEKAALPAKGASDDLSGALSGGLTGGMANAKAGADNLGSAVKTLMSHIYDSNSAVHDAVDKVRALGDVHDGTSKKATLNELAHKKAESAVVSAGAASKDAASKLQTEQDALERVSNKLKDSTSWSDRLSVSQQNQKVKIAEANSELANNKLSLAQAKLATQEYAAQDEKSIGVKAQLAIAEAQAGKAVAGSTVKKVAATATEGAMTIASGALTVAQGLLNAVVAAFPGMAMALALGLIMQAIQPVIDAVGGFIGGLLGLNDATGDVTDTTEEANQVLTEEQQRVQDNVDSINEYERSHDNLADALATSGVSIEQYAQHLEDTGQTFDEVKQAQESFVDSTINGFDKIDTSQQITFDTLAENLRSNIATQRQWSDDMQSLMERTGMDSNNALIQGLLSAGPEKMAEAVHEAINDPTGQKLEELKELAEQSGATLDPSVAEGIRSSQGDAATATGETMDSVEGAVTEGGGDVEQAASDVDEATVQRFGSHYGEAKDAGRNLAGGFGDGVAEASADATRPAEQTSAAVVTALNGGKGYSEAKSAGRNMMGGFTDGLREVANVARTEGQNAARYAQDGLGSNHWGANSAGRNEMGGFTDGLREASGGAYSAGSSAAQQAQSGAGSNYWGAYSAGSNFAWGFNNGMTSVQSTIYSNARTIASNAAQAMNSYLRIHSPSRLMMETGKYFDLGVAEGIKGYASDVTNVARAMAENAFDVVDAATKAGSAAGGAFGDGVSSSMDAVELSARVSAGYALDARPSASPVAGQPHDATGGSGDDGSVARAIASAVTLGIVNAQGPSASGGGDATIVLRVGNEELAREVAKGRASLLRRGVTLEI